MHVAIHHSVEQLEKLAAEARDAVMYAKLRALVLARRGWSAAAIGEAVGKTPRTVQNWVTAYNDRSLEGLADGRGGNHRHLSEEQERQITEHLDALAEDPEAGVRHAAELIEWIEQRFGVLYSLSGIYALLDRLGYSWLMPRPRHPGADDQAREAFKKTRRR